MKSLLAYLLLPKDITRFEREYLAKMNRVALFFFAAHVPVFGAVAFANGTGAVAAMVMTAFGVAGPFLAMRALSNPRHVSMVFGVTAMFMGAVLVHFGRGLWTIEMHFYFFVALALLAVFANPMVVVTAAVTVAVHHLALWFLSPESVFNYDAPLSSVLVHALFVVLESVAACFVARSFFDNVVGLERIVADRTRALDGKNREMKLVFDHVQQAFLTAARDGALSAQFSRAVETWFEAPKAGESAWAFFGRVDPAFGRWLALGWQTLAEDLFPREVALAQLPSRFGAGARTFEVAYQPIDSAEGQLEQVLILVTDITEKVAREEADLVQRETVQVFERLMRDRSGFLEFFAEARGLVESLARTPLTLGDAEQLRALHTLKGNCALFGVSALAAHCHELETRLVEHGGGLTAVDQARLTEWWSQASQRIMRFLGEGAPSAIQLDETDYLAILHAIDSGAPKLEVRRLIESWKNEPVQARLERFAEQASGLAERLGKAPLSVRVDAGGVRLPRDRYASLWSAFVHLVRNAVDHGVERPADRQARAKGPATLDFSAGRTREGLVVTLKDDGAGIDWELVRGRAERLGLPASTRADLVDALFADGLSTRDEASDTSGRGVGLSAVRAAARALGGDVRVSSERGLGTTFQVVLPWPDDVPAPVRADARQTARATA
ncbi:MAG: ATP-binding protein [Myxococcaceae bacterium]|jgi:signal transduction histidine kinase|nr:ATP-binding protein [Myxococcaceae bacterium]